MRPTRCRRRRLGGEHVTASARYQLDSSTQRHGTVVIGGSPLKLFRLTAAGASLVQRIADGDEVPSSTLIDSLLNAGAIHPLPNTTPFTIDDVTIVVPARGEPEYRRAGAIIVDDGSVPPIEDATIRLDVNQGPAAARNIGLTLVTTPLVAFVDADVELPDGWLEPLLAHFSDDQVGLVAPRVTTTTSGSMIARYEHRRSPLDLGPEPARIRAGTRVSYVPAAALVCRVDAISSIGGFDAGLRFGEDVDLVWRLDAAGWRCRYEPKSVVHHAPRATWSGWIRQRIGYGSSAAPLATRHRGALAPVRMSPWSLASWFLTMTRRPWLGTVTGVGSAAALIKKLPDVPPQVAFRLAGLGNLHAGDQLANAVRRVWWPLLAIAALRSRIARRVLVSAAISARHPVRLADDVAYSIGVWRGMASERSIAPLVPEFSSWPGRAQRQPEAAR